MSGLWYTAAIAATTGVIFSVASSLSQNLGSQNLGSQNFGSQRLSPTAAIIGHSSAKTPSALSDVATLEILSSVPDNAQIHSQAAAKKAQYKTLLATAQGKLNADNNSFLSPIIQAARVSPAQVHITLCQLGTMAGSPSGDLSSQPQCRHHQGDQPMASAASLIKLPIAIALLDKVTKENIDLSEKIYIDPGNFTENAAGAYIETNEQYSLNQVMTRMINQSNNIATNQLIDYVGRAQLAKTMAERGYSNTLVDHKLAGDRILPANPGSQSNRTTTHDITAMMAHTYGLENPGDEILITALATQSDREFGHQALRELEDELGSNIKWLGEKTGQNNRVIGTTLAMMVNNERYALTVAIDYSADPDAMRTLISGIAQHLAETGPLVETQRR